MDQNNPTVGTETKDWRILAPQETGGRLDPLAPDLANVPPGYELGSLPYQSLGGDGFERLCFALEVAEGRTPRLFGRSGQQDYGVDVVIETGSDRTVIQCKNLSAPPKWQDVRDAVLKFERDWLGKAHLPRPVRYAYCCPQDLNDSVLNEEWTRFRDDFHARTGIELEPRGKEYLDTRLRGLPDLVAGLFSGALAEQFCGTDDWREAPWVRVARGGERHKPVARFVERHDSRQLFVAEGLLQRFEDAFDRGPVVLIRGLPGSGKTVTGLELASRLTDPFRNIYYATLKQGVDMDRLWHTARRRCRYPSLFLLDDCHLDPEAAETLAARLRPELTAPHQPALLLLVGRHFVDEGTEATVEPELIEELKADQRIISVPTDVKQTGAVLEHLRPGWVGLSQKRLHRIHHVTGGDLLLLDEALRILDTPQEIGEFSPDALYDRLYQSYFPKTRHLPTIRKLAGLAQFDLTPLAEFFAGQWEPGEMELAAPLMGELDGPHRFSFLHSSLAEMVFRALARLEHAPEQEQEGWIQLGGDALVGYFQFLGTQVENGRCTTDQFLRDWELVLRARLKLCSDAEEGRLKTRLLVHPGLLAILESLIGRISFSILRICVLILTQQESPFTERYITLIAKQMQYLLRRNGEGTAPSVTATVVTGLYALRRYAPDEEKAIEDTFGPESFLRLIEAEGTLFEMFMVIQDVTPSFASELLEHLDAERTQALVEKTIAAGRSIGTFDLAMAVESNLLERLEAVIGPDNFLRLIEANGTLFELVMILQRATPGFASDLLERLDAERTQALVEKTIAAGCSIGNLLLAIGSLAEMEGDLLERLLEAASGPDSFLRRIEANGTLFELFRVLEHATPGIAGKLLERLGVERVQALVEKTIAAGRSIGTLHLAMRDLAEMEENLLERLEAAIGPDSFLRLIEANGTLFELFMILQHATPGFAGELLERLDVERAQTLVDKTIAAGRSIGTLDLAMRDLAEGKGNLLERLEAAIGPDSLLRLIEANGTLFELFKILNHATPGFAGELLERLDAERAQVLVEKTLSEGGSIESMHYTLGRLAHTKGQLERLQELIGQTGWWRLIRTLGTLNSLGQLATAMSDDFRAQFIGESIELEETDWRGIIGRGLFLNACTFVEKALPSFPDSVREPFRKALAATAKPLAAQADWFDLNPARDKINPESTEGACLYAALLDRVNGSGVDDLSGLDFREAVNGFTFLWYERPDLRSDLAGRLWEILPVPKEWPRDRGETAALRLVLTIACEVEIPKADALRLLQTINGVLDHEVCGEMHTLPLFLLTWNMAALRYERFEQSLVAALPAEKIDLLYSILVERVRPKGPNKEKRAQLRLAGLIARLDPQRITALRTVLEPLRGALRWLAEETIESNIGFVPTFFELEGITLLWPRNRAFPPDVCKTLLIKSREYQRIGPAVEYLRQQVQTYRHQYRPGFRDSSGSASRPHSRKRR